tara:strand:- start:81 stop:605 length:525 start_codon:yes stop_codon:yes gene_type:complete
VFDAASEWVINGKFLGEPGKGAIMSRMYSGKKGKSGSSKPLTSELPKWANTDAKSVEKLILDLAADGHSTAEIGLILRDQHAVPDVRKVCGMRIGQVLLKNEASAQVPEDLMNLMRKVVGLMTHLETNRKDLHNSRQLGLIESKIRKLSKYYIAEGLLDSNWKYSRDNVRLMVA